MAINFLMTMTRDNVVDELLKAVPEFKKYENYKQIVAEGNGALDYVVYGVLSNYLNQIYTINPKDPVLLSIAKFIELLAKSDDQKIKNLLIAGFLEDIAFKPCAEIFFPETQKVVFMIKNSNP